MTNQEIQNTREYQLILNDLLDTGMDMNDAITITMDLMQKAMV